MPFETHSQHIGSCFHDGVPADLIKDELEQTSARQDELKKQIEAQSKEVRPLIHPAMGLRYRKSVNDLRLSLKEGQGAEAKQHVRALTDKIVLTQKKNVRNYL